MQDQDKTKDQLIGEMKKMRLEIAEFRASEAIRQDSEKLLGEAAALKFREIVDKAGEAIFIVQNGEIKFSNPAALCFMTDATERKQVESALCESEQRLQLALEGAALGVWDWDVKTGRAIWDNGTT